MISVFKSSKGVMVAEGAESVRSLTAELVQSG